MDNTSTGFGFNKEGMKNFLLLTVGALTTAFGTYLFKFQNNFSFGGVAGFSVVLAEVMPFSAGTINLVVNMVLLLLGFLVLGREFGIWTAYSSVLISGTISVLEVVLPMNKPLTDQPVLELMFAIALPAVGAAMMFASGASSGGTDIIAMIIKRYSTINTSTALVVTDFMACVTAFFVFDVETGLFSMMGLFGKSLLIHGVLESMSLHKLTTIVCNNPQKICAFITKDLHRGATVVDGTGAYTSSHKYIIYTVLSASQTVRLREFVHQNEPTDFVLSTNTFEIRGNGFHTYM